MRKIVLAAVVAIAFWSVPNSASAQVPAFYGGYYMNPYYAPPSFNTYSYYTTPWGYRTYNRVGYNMTPFGWNAYNYGATTVRPIINAPYHSVYIDGTGQARWGNGYLNTPTFYQYYRYGW